MVDGTSTQRGSGKAEGSSVIVGAQFPDFGDARYRPKFVKMSTLKRWGRIKKHEEIGPDEFCYSGRAMRFARYGFSGYGLPNIVTGSNFLANDTVHFISHRWLSDVHPDPSGQKFDTLSATFPDEALVWMDFMCLPQRPRDLESEAIFLAGINLVPDLIKSSWFCAIDADREDYKDRAWCQFEAMCAIRFQSLPNSNTLSTDQIDLVGNGSALLSAKSVSPLSSMYLACREQLPKDRLPPGGEHIGAGFTRRGYYIDVPDLNDAAFIELRELFESMGVAVEQDRPILWEALRRIFPARRLDFTTEHP